MIYICPLRIPYQPIPSCAVDGFLINWILQFGIIFEFSILESFAFNSLLQDFLGLRLRVKELFVEIWKWESLIDFVYRNERKLFSVAAHATLFSSVRRCSFMYEYILVIYDTFGLSCNTLECRKWHEWYKMLVWRPSPDQ